MKSTKKQARMASRKLADRIAREGAERAVSEMFAKRHTEALRINDANLLRQLCVECGKRAVVLLSEEQLYEQPDDTTHVCHPMLGGCNLGYTIGGR